MSSSVLALAGETVTPRAVTKPQPAEQLELVLSVPLEQLALDGNIRSKPGDIAELVKSVTAVGILEPLIAYDADGLRVVAGTRRLAAAREAGLTHVPVVVRELDERARLEVMLVENLQRSDLPPLDEAFGYQRLLDLGLSQREIADRVGRSQSHVSKRVGLLQLPDAVRKKVDSGSINLEDALELTKLIKHPKRLEKVSKAEDDYRGIPALVDRELRDIRVEEKRAPVLEKLKARGIRVVGKDIGFDGKRKFCKGTRGSRDWQEIRLDAKEHAKFEACHAAIVDEKGAISYVCTNPSVHEPKTKQKNEEKKAAAEVARSAAKEADEAKRKEVLTAALAGRITKDDALALLVEYVLSDVDSFTAKIAVTLLGLDVTDSWNAASKALRAFEPAMKAAIAFAVARNLEYSLADGEAPAYVALLQRNGYEPKKAKR